MTKCLIIGGGIAGPAAAMALLRAGLESVVYEAYDDSAEGTGGFLTVAINGLDALDALDLKELVLAHGFGSPQMAMYLGSSGKKLVEFENGGVLPDGSVCQTIMRPDLYRILRDEAVSRGVSIVYGKRLLHARETADGVIAEFEDGSVAEGDVLIGADGLKSRVRTIIDPKAPDARVAPLLNTGGRVSGVPVGGPPGVMHMVFGKRCFYCYIKDPSDEIWWFANPLQRGSESLASMSDEHVRAGLIDMVKGDKTPMAAIIRATPTIMPPYATYDLPSVPTWHTNRMIIIGDAAHAASPASGQGASMAFEDALILGKCLRDHAIPAAAFRTYETIRRERVEGVVAFGKKNGDPKLRGQFKRVFQDIVLRIAFGMQSRKKDSDPTGWIVRHHIDWDKSTSRPS